MKRLEIKGFHATLKENTNSIITEGFNINKERCNDWLGHGIYLFQYKIDADTWANGTHYCKSSPSIIECFVEVEDDKYLDLDNPENLNNYDSYYNDLLNSLSEGGKSLTFKDKHEARCWGLNIYKKENNIDVIKYTFTNNRTKNAMKYENTKFGYKYNEVQICVSRNDIIVDKKLCS